MTIAQIILLLLVAVAIDKCQSQFSVSPKLYYFYGSYSNRQIYSLNEIPQMTQHQSYDPNRRTILLIHGFTDSVSGITVRSVVSAYDIRKDHNLMVLDWSQSASGDYYTQAVPNCASIGTTLGEILLTNFQNGILNISNFHVVGHSLGAQMTGYIGRTIKSRSNNNFVLPRLTGLDPAGPAFYPTLQYKPLTLNDAVFVDIIHTDAYSFGQSVSSGTADFWPNGGRSQPGCYGVALCDHIRAVDFYAESVRSNDPNAFLSAPTQSRSGFQIGRANTGQSVNMGFNCPTNARGDYSLRTNVFTPYSLGSRGARLF